MDAEQTKLERMASPTIRRFARSVIADAMRDWRQSADPMSAIDRHTSPLVETLTQGMIAGHLTARMRLINMAKAHEPVTLATVYDKAVAFLQARMLLTDDQVNILSAAYGAHAARVTNEALEPVRRAVERAVLEVTRSGLHAEAGMAVIREAYKSESFDASPFRLETLYRTQTQLAYAAGRDNAMADDAIDEILWGYEYVTVGDDRVRLTHVPLDGMRAPKDDPIWATHRPPLGWNCRCQLRPIFIGDPDATTERAPGEAVVDGMQVVPGPDDGWGFAPADLFNDVFTLTEAT